jgi:hypothetical protein
MPGSGMLEAFVLFRMAQSSIVAKKPLDTQAIQDAKCKFDCPPQVHPRFIEDLNTWLSDGGDQVVAINLTESHGSNRYFGSRTLVEKAVEKPWVMFKTGGDDSGYRHIGRSRSGMDIPQTTESRGGTVMFDNLKPVVLQNDNGLLVHEDTHAIDLGKSRVLILELGRFPWVIDTKAPWS